MEFGTKLINWYHKNKRELPWRQEVNAYFIWLSEVILQQTRVSQGLPYYLKFVKNYPTVSDLALADEEKVLKDWEGLGYYSRARNLHAAAKEVYSKYNGEFPKTYEEILSLRGIGPYTAAAIGSFAFNLPYPVVDGNVQRVIARIFGITDPVNSSKGKKAIEEVLKEMFDPNNPADFNQAIMEFGALHCKPQAPLCRECPFRDQCFAFNHKMVDVLPAKEKKTKVKSRFFLYVVPTLGNTEYIEKRTGDDIWKNLYQFPLIEMKEPLLFPDDISIKNILLENSWNDQFKIKHISQEYKHILSHRIIYARFVTIEINKKFKVNNDWKKKEKDDDLTFAFPVLIQKFFKDRS